MVDALYLVNAVFCGAFDGLAGTPVAQAPSLLTAAAGTFSSRNWIVMTRKIFLMLAAIVLGYCS
ncbi:MAG TPA: hypothetical protein VGJ15_08115, partial [Pirellulales bacterium]